MDLGASHSSRLPRTLPLPLGQILNLRFICRSPKLHGPEERLLPFGRDDVAAKFTTWGCDINSVIEAVARN